MKRSIAVVAVLLAAPSAPEIVSDELAFAPKEGLRVKKTLEMVSELKLVDYERTDVVNGEEHVSSGGEVNMTTRHEQTLVFWDEYSSVVNGRPARIDRTFETLSRLVQQEEGASQRKTFDGTSELEGQTVTFTWDEGEEAYAVAFANDDDETLDMDLLQGLDADADLTWFLPDGEVDEGNTWETDTAAYLKLTWLGGDTKIEGGDEESDEDRDRREEFYDLFGKNLEAEITCTYRGVQDGIATVVIGMEVESRFEQERTSERKGIERSSSESYSFAFELEGELRFDVEAGHALGVLLEGEGELELEVNEEVVAPHLDEQWAHSEHLFFEGPLRIEVTIE